MEHHFDIEVAKEVGASAATIYKNIQYWCEKNRANEKHFYEGEYWTYNSKKAMTELFPYLTERQIKTCLLKLEEFGYIGKNCFNENPYDRTNWYCDLKQKHRLNNIQSTGQKCPTDRTEMSNRPDRNVQCITDSKPYSKPDKKEKTNKKVFIKPPLSDVEAFFKEKGFNNVYAKKVFDYYNDADWVDSNGKKVVNWKQKMNANWLKENVNEIYRLKTNDLFSSEKSDNSLKMVY